MTFKENVRHNSIKAVLGTLPKAKGRILTVYENSFKINSAKLWNVLPPELTYINSFNAFKLGLDQFLSKVPDEPPLSGYPKKSNNSLINQCLFLNL